jgi:hypothetical protein
MKPNFKIKGTKLPNIPQGTEYIFKYADGLIGTGSTKDRFSRLSVDENDFYSHGSIIYQDIRYILAEYKNYSDNWFLMFKESTLNELYKQQNNIEEMEEETMKNKKIIGYKLIKPEYELPAITIMGISQLTLYSEKYNFKPNSIAYDKLVEAGVLDLWFKAVYGEEFKFGDHVTDDEGINIFLYDKCIKGKHYPQAKGYFKSGDKIDGTMSFGDKLRKATPEEIKAAETIKVGDYEGELKGNKRIDFNGVCYFEGELEALKSMMERGQIKSLNVGCNSQYKVDLELINKILSKFK